MQSHTRISFPYISVPGPNGSVARKVKKTVSTSCLRSVLPDLVTLWDAFSILLAGIFAAVTYSAIIDGSLPFVAKTGHLCRDLIHDSMFGALLSPLVIRDRLLRRVDVPLLRSLIQRAAGLLAITLFLTFATRSVHPAPALWVTIWFASVVLLLFTGRALAVALLRWTSHRFGGERVAVIGKGAEAEWVRRVLRKAESAGIDLVAQGRRAGSLDGVVADLIEYGRHSMLDRVILAQPGLSNQQVQQIANRLKSLQIEVTSLFPLLGAGALRRMTNLADIPLFVVSRRPQWGYGGLSKLVLDRGLALLLLLWTAPMLLIIAAAVWLDSPGPILFRQRRHGVNGTEFEIYKFRTMAWQGQGAATGTVQTGRKDARITRIGRVLRQSSLDEVPQLLNVLNGTMSLVGPRPHPTTMRTEQLLGDEITSAYPHRHRVKPGITGWAQVNGLRGATETAEQLRRRIEHDNFYIENWSPWFDLRILAMTPVILLFRRANAF